MAEILNANDAALERCIEALSKGELIIYPTDTLYGIGADATVQSAIDKVFVAKRRKPDNVVSVAVKSAAAAEDLAVFNPLARKLAEAFLPGPLTMILKSKSNMKFLSKDGKIGIRVPENDFTLSLLKKYDRPIVATSANISGGQDPKEISDIPNEIIECASVVVDYGKTKYAAPSTVVDVSSGTINVLREGALSVSSLRNYQ